MKIMLVPNYKYNIQNVQKLLQTFKDLVVELQYLYLPDTWCY